MRNNARLVAIGLLAALAPLLVVPLETWHHHGPADRHPDCTLCVLSHALIAELPAITLIVVAQVWAPQVPHTPRVVATCPVHSLQARSPPRLPPS